MHTPLLALDALAFDNRFTTELPADPIEDGPRRQVRGALFSRVHPTRTAGPLTLAWSPEVAMGLGIDAGTAASDDFAAVFSGNRLPNGADPFAMVYGGHQFGNWAGQLGDGRAMAIGEVIDADGQRQTLQLKGAGPTPYSRTADGRAVLRSSIREFLCSEAMFHLGVPTTRALSLVSTGDGVMRDMLYDGHPAVEPGAVVCRVAPSFVRFGNFQLPASRGEIEVLRALTEFTIRHDFPELLEGRSFAEQVVAFFAEVCRRTAELVVHWMRVGFVHGVLNTDNMSILGLTIDYGPYGWLEDFDPGWTPNTTDAEMKRYRYGAQPQVVHWNLVQLANALVPLIDDPSRLQAVIDTFADDYAERYRAMMSTRLGWGEHQDGDDDLVHRLMQLLARTEVDQVIFHRNLSTVPVAGDVRDDELLRPLDDAWYRPADIRDDLRADLLRWLRDWGARATQSGLKNDERRRAMDSVNPKYVLRNYLAQEIIDAATTGDAAPITEMLDVLRHPYDEQPGRERFAAKRPEWARTKVGCSMLSCSS
jgi:serine/tyrosine/threonine adenylyltransferase